MQSYNPGMSMQNGEFDPTRSEHAAQQISAGEIARVVNGVHHTCAPFIYGDDRITFNADISICIPGTNTVIQDIQQSPCGFRFSLFDITGHQKPDICSVVLNPELPEVVKLAMQLPEGEHGGVCTREGNWYVSSNTSSDTFPLRTVLGAAHTLALMIKHPSHQFLLWHDGEWQVACATTCLNVECREYVYTQNEPEDDRLGYLRAFGVYPLECMTDEDALIRKIQPVFESICFQMRKGLYTTDNIQSLKADYNGLLMSYAILSNPYVRHIYTKDYRQVAHASSWNQEQSNFIEYLMKYTDALPVLNQSVQELRRQYPLHNLSSFQ